MMTSKFFGGVRGFAIVGFGSRSQNTFVLFLLFAMLFTTVAEAGFKVKTKSKKRWGRTNTKYIARAHSGCGLLLLCKRSSYAWNTSVSTGCDKRCLIPGTYARSGSTNGPTGGWGWTSTKGLGWAGLSGEGSESSAAETQVRSSMRVDDREGLVVLTLTEGILAAAPDGSFSEIEITIARLRPEPGEATEGPGGVLDLVGQIDRSAEEVEIQEFEEEEIPLESVLWNGMIRVSNGEVEYPEQLAGRGFRLTERETEDGIVLQQVRLDDLRIEVPFDPRESGDIVVEIRGDSGGGEAEEEATVFLRGDANTDGVVDLADPISLLGELFLGDTRPSTCAEAGDANGDGGKDVADAVYLLSWSFSGGAAPVAPGPEVCGSSPGGEVLGCEEYTACP